ncbi:Transmembrane and TPR repeat-containing protein 1-like [Heracleum sosnowskyi]|uniref:Transmembrane and TPR repeat-containing protein 1-like n=1 Tax=Heracleum sosnowskyi TaxID=360622 RepID=A0AAD8MPZ1_9APIA|nr:Transmembrane and TPR repeat-containing protein 1-like [Heracleum sosnowskyi]
MALNSPLITKFDLSLFRIIPRTLVAPPLNLSYKISKPYKTATHFRQSIKAKAPSQEPIFRNLRNTAVVIVFAASMMVGKFQSLASRAENQPILTEEITSEDETKTLSSDAIETLTLLLDQKYEAGDYDECLRILKELISAQPERLTWKLLLAKVFKQMGETEKAFHVLDEVLSKNPIEPHALFENAVWMGFEGKEEEAIERLEKALKIAKERNNATEIRDVRLVIAQVKLVQKKPDEALKSFNELENEDPTDIRIVFFKGLLYYCTDRKAEATEQFDKYFELIPNAPPPGDDGYLTTFPKIRPPGI